MPILEIPEGRKILTVHWTSKVDKYWRQGGE
jgi:general stress protein 26